jgi:O-antigen/teichoic acid export membrane protein
MGSALCSCPNHPGIDIHRCLLRSSLLVIAQRAIRSDIARHHSSERGRALSQAGFGWLGPYTAGLLAGEVLGRCAGLTRMLRSTWPVLSQELAGSNFHQLIETLKRNRQFAVYSLPSSLLDTIASSISLPLIVFLYGLNAGGSYALVSRVLDLPTVLITANVADAFHSRAALISQENPAALPGLVKRMSAILLLAGFGPAAILVAFGPRLFQWVFGSKWGEAGVMAA